jgi:hypothetical protein
MIPSSMRAGGGESTGWPDGLAIAEHTLPAILMDFDHHPDPVPGYDGITSR